jgi:hypothetical protein
VSASAPNGAEADNINFDAIISAPIISADGRFVAFHSSATKLVGGDTNGVFDVFVAEGFELIVIREAILSPVVSGPTEGKAEIVFGQSGTEIQQQFSVRIERALANNSYRILVDISSGEPVDSGQRLDFGFVETDHQGNATRTWSSRDIRPILPPGKDVRDFVRVMVAHGGGTIIFLSGKF